MTPAPFAAALEMRARDPREYVRLSTASMAAHVRAMLALQERGAVTFDYGNNLRGQAKEAGVEDAFPAMTAWSQMSTVGAPATLVRTSDAAFGPERRRP